jgi:hypothetical protein
LAPRLHFSRRLDGTKREHHIPSMPPHFGPADDQLSVPPPPVIRPPVIACSFGQESRIFSDLILIFFPRSRAMPLPPDEVIE